MFPEIELIRLFARGLQDRKCKAIDNEGGYSTEAVVITALLAALAIAAVAVITVKVMAKANDLPTE